MARLLYCPQKAETVSEVYPVQQFSMSHKTHCVRHSTQRVCCCCCCPPAFCSVVDAAAASCCNASMAHPVQSAASRVQSSRGLLLIAVPTQTELTHVGFVWNGCVWNILHGSDFNVAFALAAQTVRVVVSLHRVRLSSCVDLNKVIAVNCCAVQVSTPTLNVACVWNILSGNDFKGGVVFGVVCSSAEAWRCFRLCAGTGLAGGRPRHSKTRRVTSGRG